MPPLSEQRRRGFKKLNVSRFLPRWEIESIWRPLHFNGVDCNWESARAARDPRGSVADLSGGRGEDVVQIAVDLGQAADELLPRCNGYRSAIHSAEVARFDSISGRGGGNNGGRRLNSPPPNASKDVWLVWKQRRRIPISRVLCRDSSSGGPSASRDENETSQR
ncbi:unnamed protein product [Lampetra fluviatilis]